VALLGNGVYSYGAINVESELAYVSVCGSVLVDPYYLTKNILNNPNWDSWTSFGFTDPKYFPGYGLAIVGNPSTVRPTIINYNESLPYTGFINVKDGAKIRLQDDGPSGRTIGRYSYIQDCIILDGCFIANCLFNLENRSSAIVDQNLFRTNEFTLSSKYILYNNRKVNDSFKLEISDYNLNFKYINFNGSFATFNPYSWGFSNWTFKLIDAYQGSPYNSFLNVYNNVIDDYYSFYDVTSIRYIKLSKSLNSIGHINYLVPSSYNTNDIMYYTELNGLKRYNELGIFNLDSPTLQPNTNYTLNFYTPSTR
jgi:hypothetical protein